jgi:protein SCO1/2
MILMLLTLVMGRTAFAEGLRIPATPDNGVGVAPFSGRRPILLVPVYFKCPNICDVSVEDLLRVVSQARLKPGRDLDVLIVSFDPTERAEDAAAFAARVRNDMPSTASAPLHFLLGTAPATAAWFQALGLIYAKGADGQYAHPAAAAMLAPNGHVVTRLSAVSATAADVRQALAAARAAKPLSLGEFIVACFHGSDIGRPPTRSVIMAVRAGGVLTVCLMIAVFVRWRLRRGHEEPQ